MRRHILNDIIKLRRKIYLEISKGIFEGNIKERIPKLPKILIPVKNGDHKPRIFYEREIVKEKIKFALGLNYDKVKDLELYELTESLDEILSGTSPLNAKTKHMGVISHVCNECPGGRFYVTDLCRNCLAHTCMSSCPRKAIEISDGKALINRDKCINCGLCALSCPYKAIMKLERPCESSCVPRAITFEGTMFPIISEEKCVTCGMCEISCPFGAIETVSNIAQVAFKLSRKEKMTVIFAPSAVGQMGGRVTLEQFRTALRELGFHSVYEVAIGADWVAEAEARHLSRHREPMFTSCCPAFVKFIKTRFQSLSSYISPVPSPMIALAKKLKEKDPCVPIVFVGPCIAKKREAVENGVPDFVLTFEELGALFAAAQIEPSQCEGEDERKATPTAWNFASSGGVAKAVVFYLEKAGEYELVQNLSIGVANGLAGCEETLNSITKGKIEYDLVEGMACEGGCVAGPGVLTDPRMALKELKKLFNLNEVRK